MTKREFTISDTSHPIEPDSKALTEQRINYIQENPVRSGLAANAEDYLLSSARNYTGLSSLLETDKIQKLYKRKTITPRCKRGRVKKNSYF